MKATIKIGKISYSVKGTIEEVRWFLSSEELWEINPKNLNQEAKKKVTRES